MSRLSRQLAVLRSSRSEFVRDDVSVLSARYDELPARGVEARYPVAESDGTYCSLPHWNGRQYRFSYSSNKAGSGRSPHRPLDEPSRRTPPSCWLFASNK